MLENIRARLTALARRWLSVEARRAIVRKTRWPAVGLVRFGSLRRLTPISPHWGSERGKPIDRFYIEAFLKRHKDDIRGHVLEIGDDTYTRAFGSDRVDKSTVLHVAEERPGVNVIADLTRATNLPDNSFDCLILTQTLQTIFELDAAIGTVYRILKPGGVVLATVPGISKVSRYDMDRWGYYWSFTSQSVARLFASRFPEKQVEVQVHGNVLAAIAFLHGLAAEELKPAELDHNDPDYELVVTVRAEKQGPAV